MFKRSFSFFKRLAGDFLKLPSVEKRKFLLPKLAKFISPDSNPSNVATYVMYQASCNAIAVSFLSTVITAFDVINDISVNSLNSEGIKIFVRQSCLASAVLVCFGVIPFFAYKLRVNSSPTRLTEQSIDARVKTARKNNFIVGVFLLFFSHTGVIYLISDIGSNLKMIVAIVLMLLYSVCIVPLSALMIFQALFYELTLRTNN